MNKEELLGKELSNLYAIAKQINHYFNDSDISFLSERTQHIVMDYVKFSCKNEERTAESLRSINVNPGNTSDSIVNEITENLHDIAVKKGYSDGVRQAGYMMSVNRLMSYHIANIENIDYLLQDVDLTIDR